MPHQRQRVTACDRDANCSQKDHVHVQLYAGQYAGTVTDVPSHLQSSWAAYGLEICAVGRFLCRDTRWHFEYCQAGMSGLCNRHGFESKPLTSRCSFVLASPPSIYLAQSLLEVVACCHDVHARTGFRLGSVAPTFWIKEKPGTREMFCSLDRVPDDLSPPQAPAEPFHSAEDLEPHEADPEV